MSRETWEISEQAEQEEWEISHGEAIYFAHVEWATHKSTPATHIDLSDPNPF